MNADRIPPGRQPATTAQSSPVAGGRRILVVDDDHDIRRLNSVLLKCAGYEVDTAENGVGAWEALNAESYDLLLTDHDMPRMTGIELVKMLRAALKAMPVILMSGMMPTEELSRHPRLQIEAVLYKPYHGEELLATVEEVLGAGDGPPERTGPLNRRCPPSTEQRW